MKLTAIDILGSLLGLGAGAVLRLGLGGDAGLGAVGVEVALVVHGLLECVALPAEDVVAVGGSATVSTTLVLHVDIDWDLSNKDCLCISFYSPEVHAVDVWVAAVGGEVCRVGELVDVPHKLVHDLRELDRVGRGAGAAASGTRAGAVGDVALVVWAVKVLAIPASVF